MQSLTVGVVAVAVSDTAGIRLFVGGHAYRVQGELACLYGDRCFSAVHEPPRVYSRPDGVVGLLDSGAFSDPIDQRLTPEQALCRQLAWEERASQLWGGPWQASYLVSYDLLIDEVWTGTTRTKRRWSRADAEWAVRETVAAAAYLASQRGAIVPRVPVLSVQGVDAEQYADCAQQVLRYAVPGDWIGLGGWCILGRWQSWLPEFGQAMRLVLPMVAAAGITHVHLFGVLWEPALGGILWLADQYGITVSTDSTAPLLAAAGKNHVKSGARCPYWRDNVAWWRARLANLRTSRWYRPLPAWQRRLWVA